MTDKNEKIPMAICYDFDGTLAPGNMQEYGFIEQLGMTPQMFWTTSNQLAREQKGDAILSYMLRMKEESEIHKLPFTKEAFKQYASQVELFPGVEKWFARINDYADKRGVALEHYIISSGLKEMVEGTSIAPYFKEIFASSFMYNDKDEAVWPAMVVNYTNKTQFLYRINKGCLDVSDNDLLNSHMEDSEKPMPFSNMIYIGDGETDIPSMKTVKREGGYAIAVYQRHVPIQEQKVRNLVGVERADVIAPADYRPETPMDVFVKGIIDKIVADTHLKTVQEALNQIVLSEEK